jgi:glycosidase/outer membrane protein assembly factor BamB
MMRSVVRKVSGPAFGLLVLVMALVVAPAREVEAATFRNWIAQQPALNQAVPGQVVRVWINSDTALGESACLEYNPVGTGTFVKLCGTFDTSFPGANWRVDIPASVQVSGTSVRYQLFNRNEFGNDYGFTGFNWQYNVTDIHWNGLYHDTFDPTYRSPFGPRPMGSTVNLKMRTERLNVNAVVMRVYQLNPDKESSTAFDLNVPFSSNDATYDYWQITTTLPTTPTIWYYKFKLLRGNDGPGGGLTDWYSDAYADDHDNLAQGGTGSPNHSEPPLSFQLSVYDPAFSSPAWLKNGTVYQIFPDRFRNGDTSNDPPSNPRTFYGDIPATFHTTWNDQPEDGRETGFYNRDFFGGDLQGITNKLDYLKNLGITAIYLNPIVKAPSNHRYDTDNYQEVDPYLGSMATFQTLAAQADARGIRLILDGVYNHTSSDSLYFDRYHRYASDGACESVSSIFRAWFPFFAQAGGPCAGPGGPNTMNYDGWFGYASLPVMDKSNAQVRDFIFGASNNTLLPPGHTENVTEFWYNRGADGWRFDVADDPSFHHDFWQAFRPKSKGYNSDGPLIGEIWPDASPWLLGDELDSAMNYRFRKAVLGFARCSAAAQCFDWTDNDNNGSNYIKALKPSELDRSLRSIREDYAPEAHYGMLNLVDSHDTNRVLYVLRFSSEADNVEAKKRLKMVAALQFTYMGAPTIYYGDEIALNAPSQAITGTNGPEDDPYNRAPYPWPDTSGFPHPIYGTPDASMYAYYQQLANIRKNYSALRTGDFRNLLTDDANLTYAFGRSDATAKMVVALNNDVVTHTLPITVTGYIANGTVLTDQLTGNRYTVASGIVSVPLGPKSVVILADTAAPDAVEWSNGLEGAGAALAAPGVYWDNATPTPNTYISVAGNSGIVRSLRANGTERWFTNLNSPVQNRAPVINVNGSNTIFVTSQDGWVTALNAETGFLNWHSDLGESVVAGVAYQPNVATIMGPRNLIFAGTFNNDSTLDPNKLVAFDANSTTTGDVVWTFLGTVTATMGIMPTTPAVDYGSNTIFFGTNTPSNGPGSRGVWAVNTTNGVIRWVNTSIGGVTNSAPTISPDGQTLYIGTVDGTTFTLYALRTSDGSVRASFTAPAGVGDFRGAPWAQGVGGGIVHLYAVAGDRVYAFSDSGGTGTLPFKPGWNVGFITVPGAGTPLVFQQRGHLYVGGNNGDLYKVNLADGTITNRVYFDAPAAVSDVTYDRIRNAFYVTSNGRIYSIKGDW